MNNIEVKTPLPDLAGTVRRLREIGATEVWTRRQTDTFYAVPRGWLKLREAGGAGAELISYRREMVGEHLRESEYDVRPLDDVVAWHRLLGRVLDIDAIVEKERTLWMWRHTRVHLDRVRGLGDYLELETVARDIDRAAALVEADEAVELLGLDPERFIAVPYRDLLSGTAGAPPSGGPSA